LKIRENRGPRWAVVCSEDFEKGYYKRAAHIDACWDLLDSLDEALCANPYAAGELFLDESGEELWVWISPAIARLPTVTVIYRIDAAKLQVVLLSIIVL
jgi:hypothetical protein